jgi:DNA-binding response OmpR family regulator
MSGLILVASANPEIRRLCRRDLARRGFDVLIAHTSWEALRTARLANPNALIIDSDVPGRAIRHLMQDLADSGLPTVLVAGLQKCNLMDVIPLADEFVSRPTADNLATAITSIVARCARRGWSGDGSVRQSTVKAIGHGPEPTVR